MNKLKKYTWLFITVLIGLSSCADDTLFKGEDENTEFRTVRLKVRLGSDSQTRAGQEAAIGDGRLITTLIYEMYDAEGNPINIPDPNDPYNTEGVMQARIENIKMPYEDLVLNVPRKSKYRLVFWAQCEQRGEDGADMYYDTDELKNILVRYDNASVENSRGQHNNTDHRDVYCYSEILSDDFGEKDEVITLTRPVAQVNILFNDKAWKRLHNNNVHVRQSSVTIANVARRFNLFLNSVDLSNGFEDPVIGATSVEDGSNNTQSYTIADFDLNTIPKYMFNTPGFDEDEGDESEEALYQWLPGDAEKGYHWVSMSYILAPGISQIKDGEIVSDAGMVDITDIKFYDKDGNDYGLPFTSINNVPVKRNYRTNILIDELFNATLKVVKIDLNQDTYDDMLNENGVMTEGQIAPGLSYRIKEGNSKYGGNFKAGLEFYVSSVRGLKWLADRTNQVKYTKEDIPTWKNSKGEDDTYSYFKDDEGKICLKAYLSYLFDLVDGRTFINGGINKDKFYNLVPWSYDECDIILTCDLDFDTDIESKQNWLGFNVNIGIDIPGENLIKYWHPKDPNGRTDPYYYHAFKGIIEGNGYTIYNMTINTEGGEINSGPNASMKGRTDKYRTTNKLNDAGLIATSAEAATIRNLRLYNADVTGDWNVGAFSGRHEGEYKGVGLTLINCQLVNSSVRAVDGISPSNDANAGGLVGSVPGRMSATDCSVINSTIYSDYIGGTLAGYVGSSNKYINCTVQSVDLVLNEMNTLGTYKSFYSLVKNPRPSGNDNYLFGNNQDGIPAKENVKIEDVNVNLFYGYKTTTDNPPVPFGADTGRAGNCEISNLPLQWFPNIYAKYAHSVTLKSHIKGLPDVKQIEKWKDTAYEVVNCGIYIDASERLKESLQADNKEYGYVLRGDPREQLYTINVGNRSENDITLGVLIDGKEKVKISDLIISGAPSINYGICLYDAQDVTIDNVAVYDVQNAINTFSSSNGPTDKRLKVTNSDLRGRTIICGYYTTHLPKDLDPSSQTVVELNDPYGGKIIFDPSKYNYLTFDKTVFNIGSGKLENKFGLLGLGADTSLNQCVFRRGFQILINKGITVRMNNCKGGAPAFANFLSIKEEDKEKEYYYKNFIHPDSKGSLIIDGQTINL